MEFKDFSGPLIGKDRVRRYVESLRRKDKVKRIYQPLIEKILSEATRPPKRILDIGTGPGFLALEFAKRIPTAFVAGLDLSPDMVEYAENFVEGKDLKNLQFVLGDAQEIPFEDGYFDIVVSHGMIKCVSDVRKMLNEVYRVLSGDGCAYLIDSRKDVFPEEFDNITENFHSIDKKKSRRSIDKSYQTHEIKKILNEMSFNKNTQIEVKGLTYEIKICKPFN
ncbi:class I SAM-dependent methyltransferase [Candidatus Oleimmundimicrobium sp.]|uniref:class I SAM-dependent methyltransferase n=1 Tax=Candidatus Oleimmundimicrobium sp. TaxID=3060597 RepID=UPI0027236652|nr:class I SAM-dependent methyltransferase [Candidatus Oleimmundimicrobium sp.]MDO8886428.1 class I SAM-dependent methyltransferase [Candidatus Oleimmundimicrobium sp.]